MFTVDATVIVVAAADLLLPKDVALVRFLELNMEPSVWVQREGLISPR